MATFGFVRYDHSSLQRFAALKVLVGVLDPQRRSASSDRLDQQLIDLLCSPPPRDQIPRFLGQEELGKRRKFPNNVAEALLWRLNAPSLLFTITDKKRSRIREWGHQLGLIGRGNQITERGLLLRKLIPSDQLEAIRAKRLFISNPFALTIPERAYFFYLLLESDATWPSLFRLLASISDNGIISGLEADKLTCRALIELLNVPLSRLSGTQLLQYRHLKELALKMAASLRIKHEAIERLRPPGSAAVPRPIKIGARSAPDKIRTNTADDQAIPRFENLVDLGFLVKVDSESNLDGDDVSSVRQRLEWQYFVAQPLVAWVKAAGQTWAFGEHYLWNYFAKCFAASFLTDVDTLEYSTEPIRVLRVLMHGYELVRRPFGHTPFESIAKIAMLQALQSGVVCEMNQLYQLVFYLKKSNLFPDYLKFAAGNDLDRMFVEIRPGFLEEASRKLPTQIP
jgi:hypothetical protein